MRRVEPYGSQDHYKWRCVLCGSNITYQVMTFFDYGVTDDGVGIVVLPIIPINNLSRSLSFDDEEIIVNNFSPPKNEDYSFLFHFVVLS